MFARQDKTWVSIRSAVDHAPRPPGREMRHTLHIQAEKTLTDETFRLLHDNIRGWKKRRRRRRKRQKTKEKRKRRRGKQRESRRTKIAVTLDRAPSLYLAANTVTRMNMIVRHTVGTKPSAKTQHATCRRAASASATRCARCASSIFLRQRKVHGAQEE
jgi:hypothetical protein